MTEFDRGVLEGLLRAIDLLTTHCETTSNQPPYRYLSYRKSGLDLTNAAFITQLREMAADL